MLLNDTSSLSLPEGDDETPRSSRTVKAIALVGLAHLTGTDAEIQAAESIRERILIAADDFLTELRSSAILTEEQADTAISVPQPVTHTQVQSAQTALNRLRHQTAAAWWISHGDSNAETLLHEFEGENG